MDSVRLLNDNNRYYVVIENPTDADKKAAMDFVSKLMGIPVKEEVPIGILPNQVVKYEVPKNLEEVPVKRPVQKQVQTQPQKQSAPIPFLNTPEDFMNLYFKMEDMGEEERKPVAKKCKIYMLTYFKRMHQGDIADMKKFLLDFEKLFKETIHKAVKENGYHNLQAFLNTENEMKVRSLYQVCRDGIKNELNIS